jgi:GTP-binding protein HflX
LRYTWGAIGIHGSCEAQLETDRLIRNKIRHLKQQLEEVRRHRALYRRRACHGVPVVWLVGYTNAGREIRFRPLPPPGQLAERWPLSRRLER